MQMCKITFPRTIEVWLHVCVMCVLISKSVATNGIWGCKLVSLDYRKVKHFCLLLLVSTFIKSLIMELIGINGQFKVARI